MRAIRDGEITAEHACTAFNIDPEELERWTVRFAAYGQEGLKVRHLQELAG